MVDAGSVADVTEVAASLQFGRIVVIGGGCYGSWYVQQLSRAFAKGALSCTEVIVVDRNRQPPARDRAMQGDFGQLPVRFVCSTWSEFIATWLDEGEERVAHDALPADRMQ